MAVRARATAALCLTAGLMGAGALEGQTPLAIAPGVVQERVVSASNAEQQFAVYLPRAYDAARVWPLAILMDPRGRALIPLELARAAAERHGYVLISSYNTVSDSTAEPNIAAVEAILTDARRLLSIHPRSIILVGFSGTARLAWSMASAHSGIAGIFGAGASGTAFASGYAGQVRPVAFYGVAGSTDFNHDEYVLFRPWLDRLRLPYRMRVFEGGHAWPPAPYFDEGLAWFRLRAMRDSLIDVDTALVSALHARDSVAADSLERAGRLADARDRWREILADYAGLRDTAMAHERHTALERNRRTNAQAREREEQARSFVAFSGTLREWLQHLREDDRAPSERRVLQGLGIAALKRQARDEDPETAASAMRRIEHAFVNLSFYLPRELLGAGRADRALRSLDIAERLRADAPTVALFRARAHMQLGDTAAALDALEDAVRRGMPVPAIARDPTFAALAGSPRYEALVGAERTR